MKIAKMKLLQGKHHIGEKVFHPGDVYEIKAETDERLAHYVEVHSRNRRAELVSEPSSGAPKTQAASSQARQEVVDAKQAAAKQALSEASK